MSCTGMNTESEVLKNNSDVQLILQFLSSLKKGTYFTTNTGFGWRNEKFAKKNVEFSSFGWTFY